QESALLLAMNQVAKNKELYLENYYLKNKRSIEKGKNGPAYAWLVPAGQRRKADAADMINDLKQQGLEVHRANSALKVGGVVAGERRRGWRGLRADCREHRRQQPGGIPLSQ